MTESESFHRYSGVDGFSISVRVGHTAAEFELHRFIGRDRLQNQCAARRILLDCARHFGARFWIWAGPGRLRLGSSLTRVRHTYHGQREF